MGTVLSIVVAVLVGLLILRVGIAVLRAFAQPVPEPPEAGELRKVRLTYRCDVCGTEVRMTVAADSEPEPPRHCQEDMVLMTPLDE